MVEERVDLAIERKGRQVSDERWRREKKKRAVFKQEMHVSGGEKERKQVGYNGIFSDRQERNFLEREKNLNY